MKLPNCTDAFVPPEKLSLYRLSESHPTGRSKAKYLLQTGYNRDDLNRLEGDLLAIAQQGDISEIEHTTHGIKYIIEDTVTAPNGLPIFLRTVWIIEGDESSPRFVTTYPKSRGH